MDKAVHALSQQKTQPYFRLGFRYQAGRGVWRVSPTEAWKYDMPNVANSLIFLVWR